MIRVGMEQLRLPSAVVAPCRCSQQGIQFSERSAIHLTALRLERTAATSHMLCALVPLVPLSLLAARAAKRVHHDRRLWKRPPVALAASADKDDDEEDAEAQLAALEAELAALEEEMEDGLGNEVDDRGAALKQKVDGLLDSVPVASASGVVPNAPPSASLPLGCIAVCSLSQRDKVSELLLARLSDAATLGVADSRWVNLSVLEGLPLEKAQEELEGCQTAVICCDSDDDASETLEKTLRGLKALLQTAPDELVKVVLLSRLGAQQSKGGFNIGAFFGDNRGTSWDDLEDELTKSVRLRTSSRPLRSVIIRAGKLQGDREGKSAIKCSSADDCSEGRISCKMAAEAVFQALSFSVDTDFAVMEDEQAATAPEWSELLLPFIGPEIWRTEVDNAKRAVFFVQTWADEFFGVGKRASRIGVKTPVQCQRTPAGVILKFRPLNTPDSYNFNDLDEGGIELLVEEPASGPPRLRAIRCDYGWKVSVKLNSEKALLDKLAKDWAESETQSTS